MLFDGAIRFVEQAKPRMTEKDIEGTHNLLIRAQRIVLELISALDKAIGEELYKNLTGLYVFVYGRLVEANVQRNPTPLDEAVRILRMMRGTWSEAIEKAQKGAEESRGTAPAAKAEAAESIQLSVEG